VVGKNYKPSMTPELIPAREFGNPRRKEHTMCPAQIKVSGAYLETRKAQLTYGELQILRTCVTGTSICPEQYWFEDTPRMRELLGVPV
jgi:hypothetical protein